MTILLFFLLIVALLLEGTVTTLPLVLVVLLCLTIIRRDAIVFPVAFVAGIFLDVLMVRTIGISSLFFIVIFFLILLYQRKYEINSYQFVGAAAFFGSLGYLWIFGRGNMFLDSLIVAFFALVLFALARHRERYKERNNLGYKSL